MFGNRRALRRFHLSMLPIDAAVAGCLHVWPKKGSFPPEDTSSSRGAFCWPPQGCLCRNHSLYSYTRLGSSIESVHLTYQKSRTWGCTFAGPPKIGQAHQSLNIDDKFLFFPFPRGQEYFQIPIFLASNVHCCERCMTASIP